MRLPSEHADDVLWPAGIVVNSTPVRRVHTRSRRRNTSLVYSTKPLGMRVSESSVEDRFLKVAQLDPGVECVRAQPVWLRVVEDGRIRRRAPDAAIMYRGRAEIHEVKQDAECWRPDVRSELLAVRAEVERHPGWAYRVSLESALLAEPLRSNTDLLWRELRPEEEVDRRLRLRTTALLNEGALVAAELIEATLDEDLAASATWQRLLSMIAIGMVDFDVCQLLTPETVVWNRNSGPPRERMLPAGTAHAAIARPTVAAVQQTFLGLQIRSASR